MKYIDADIIRTEIERLKRNSESAKREWIKEGYNQNAFADDCRISSFDKLLSLIDSLQQEQQEEPDKSLEEAAEEYIKKGYLPVAFVVRPAFIAGAKWQAEQDDRDVVFWKGMQYAIKGMKEEAVDGIYSKSMDGKNVFVESSALKIDPESVKVGDSVKLIIIKDDGKSD